MVEKNFECQENHEFLKQTGKLSCSRIFPKWISNVNNESGCNPQFVLATYLQRPCCSVKIKILLCENLT